jgi:signal peptidase I
MSNAKRYLIAAFVIIVVVAIVGVVSVRLFFSAPGLDKPIKVQDGSVQIKGIERVDYFEAPNGQKVTPNIANQFVFIDVSVEGTVPLAGKDAGTQNLLNGEWQLTDASGASYSPKGLVSGRLLFEVDRKATGLALNLGQDVKIPLEKPKTSLFGNTSRLKMAGKSMEPNFSDGQTIVAEPVEDIASLHRGDVIIFTQDGNLMIKRLIALPGETVEIHQGSIIINGEVYKEPYKVIPPTYEQEPLKLGEDEYYVLGDNRDESSDSHNFGPITGKMITKRVVP